MSIIIKNNNDFARYLNLWTGEMQRMGDSFEMLIIPVSHATSIDVVEMALKTLPGYSRPLVYGGVEHHVGTITLNREHTVADAIAEINCGNVSPDARAAAINNLADREETDTFDFDTNCGVYPVHRKAFAARLRLPLQCEAKRSYRLSFCSDAKRGQRFLVITRGDQPEPTANENSADKGALLSELNTALLLDRAKNPEGSQYSLRLDTSPSGRSMLRHADFQIILSNLRPDHVYFARIWHRDLRLEI